MRDFQQLDWDAAVAEDCRQLIHLAVREDLERQYDWTTVALVGPDAQAQAAMVARRPGIISGLAAAALVLAEMDALAVWTPELTDGSVVTAGTVVATIAGPARTLLTAERTLLNFVGRLSGISTLTLQYVDAVSGTGARIYDTRKTTPGWRRLEKYAVRKGGGHNHRTGLFDAILIKDNHLAFGGGGSDAARFTPAQAVRRAREFLAELAPGDPRSQMPVEVEVDTLEQLDQVLPERPDIVLLDNMPPAMLAAAVERRNRVAPQVELEASGGVSLASVRAIAETGVERISAVRRRTRRPGSTWGSTGRCEGAAQKRRARKAASDYTPTVLPARMLSTSRNSSRGLNGLESTVTTPLCSTRSMCSGSKLLAVSMMIGSSCGAKVSRTRRLSSSPSIRGICKSVTRMSGRSARIACQASSPLGAVRT